MEERMRGNMVDTMIAGTALGLGYYSHPYIVDIFGVNFGDTIANTFVWTFVGYLILYLLVRAYYGRKSSA